MLLRVRELEKNYRLHDGALARFVDLAGCGLVRRHRSFPALAPLSFDLDAGEALAVIGANGSGKSTLARLVAGVSPPSGGSIELEGQAAGLLGLGTGFHPDFTGEQNVRIAMRLLGVPARRMEERLAETLAFAEIGDFARSPMRTYSAGMVARLGFSVLTAVRPQLFVLDEAFAAGDLYFHRKCWETLQGMKERGMAFLVVTHNLDLARLFCDRSLWLHEGRLRGLGPTEEVCLDYEAFHRERRLEGLEPPPPGEGRLAITALRFVDVDGEERQDFSPGEEMGLLLDWTSPHTCPGAVFGITLHDGTGALLWGANNHDLGPGAWKLDAGRGRAELRLTLPPLRPGTIHVTATAHERPAAPFWHRPDDFHYQRWSFRVVAKDDRPGSSVGPLVLPGAWRRLPAATEDDDAS